MIDKNNDPRKAMKVPDGFFENFEDQLMDAIDLKNNKLTISSKRNYYGLAAVFILLLGAMVVFKFSIPEKTPGFADLSVEENWDYLIENYDEFTYEEIASFEESEEVLLSLEQEIYGSIDPDDLLEDIDLEILESLYE